MPFNEATGLTFLTVQVAGVTLTATLLSLLAAETRRPFVRWWAAAWVALALGHAGLLLWSLLAGGRPPWLLPYVAGEYAFAVLAARGFMVFRLGEQGWARGRWLLVALVFWSVLLILVAGTADLAQRFHAVTLGVLLLLAFDEARRVAAPAGLRTGRRVTLAALLALSGYFVAAGLLQWLGAQGLWWARALLPLRPLLDVVLYSALGFGQVLLVMETVTAELAAARDQLEIQARVDPLTSALNRHAFHTLFADRTGAYAHAAGCAVVIDIDNLKQLNDTRGHAAGDQAIRAAAGIIRNAIRADDLLFRWGGDEFLAVLFGVSEDKAHARLRALSEHRRANPAEPHLSWGIAAFEGAPGMAAAIEAADRAMYASRARRRSGRA